MRPPLVRAKRNLPKAPSVKEQRAKMLMPLSQVKALVISRISDSRLGRDRRTVWSVTVWWAEGASQWGAGDGFESGQPASILR
ncbi:MAG: hypothetical protein ACKER6_00525 [Candidatus Hodgkinia cicadicola]